MELRDWNDLLRDEDGMGTVEIILIIVDHRIHSFQVCFTWKNRGFQKMRGG